MGCVKTKIVYHVVILNDSEGSVYIHLCLQIIRKAQNDRLSDSAIGVLTHPLSLYPSMCFITDRNSYGKMMSTGTACYFSKACTSLNVHSD